MIRLILIVAIVFSLVPAGVEAAPESWALYQPPKNSGCERKAPDNFVQARADFDGNGKEDVARIEVEAKSKKVRLAVWMNGDELPMILDNSGPYDNFVGVEGPGTVVTWCGKTGECKKGEKKKVRLKHPAIAYGTCESSMVIYVWDDKDQRFYMYWISD